MKCNLLRHTTLHCIIKGNLVFFAADGFPTDFSIIATVRPNSGTKGFLFSMYGGTSQREVLALEISDTPYLLFEDNLGRPGPQGSPRFNKRLADGG